MTTLSTGTWQTRLARRLYIALLPFVGEAVFWLTGGLGYVVPLVLGLLWLSAARRSPFPGHLNNALLKASALPVSLMNEQISAALLAAGACAVLVGRKHP